MNKEVNVRITGYPHIDEMLHEGRRLAAQADIIIKETEREMEEWNKPLTFRQKLKLYFLNKLD